MLTGWAKNGQANQLSKNLDQLAFRKLTHLFFLLKEFEEKMKSNKKA